MDNHPTQSHPTYPSSAFIYTSRAIPYFFPWHSLECIISETSQYWKLGRHPLTVLSLTTLYYLISHWALEIIPINIFSLNWFSNPITPDQIAEAMTQEYALFINSPGGLSTILWDILAQILIFSTWFVMTFVKLPTDLPASRFISFKTPPNF